METQGNNCMNRYVIRFISGIVCFSLSPINFAATEINLRHTTFSQLRSLTQATLTNKLPIDFEQTKIIHAENGITHIRIKQHYAGIPVWGGDAIIHTPTKTLKPSLKNILSVANDHSIKTNGIIYQGLEQDLGSAPKNIFSTLQTQNALTKTIELYKKEKGGNVNVLQTKQQPMVYVDKNNKAHWTFVVNLLVKPANRMQEEPIYIIDAQTFEVYEQWNNFKTLELEEVKAGGYGGIYSRYWLYDYVGDDIKWFSQHYPALDIMRDETTGVCYMQNDYVTIKDGRTKEGNVINFSCPAKDPKHYNLYWNEKFDEANGGYSPSNDLLYNAAIVKRMYENEYWTGGGRPVIVDQNGEPAMLNLSVHASDMENNAAWSDFTADVKFGDGGKTFYPLVSLGIVAHELSHGFTSQNSGLIYKGQSGGLNESFSDIASMTAIAYASADGYVPWVIGEEVTKDGNPIRYMNNPRHDCIGKRSGEMCSIDNAKDYNEASLGAFGQHQSSGVFNKAFYLLSTSQGWNIVKAFRVMVQANIRYWYPRVTFAEAACGVMDATHDYGYDEKTVTDVMQQVGLDTSKC